MTYDCGAKRFVSPCETFLRFWSFSALVEAGCAMGDRLLSDPLSRRRRASARLPRAEVVRHPFRSRTVSKHILALGDVRFMRASFEAALRGSELQSCKVA
jgi:hypothetical protein